MSESTLWWVIAGFFVSLEVLSGSLYLFMLAVGAAAAALTALSGGQQMAQLIVAALVGGSAVLFWHRQLLKRGVLDTQGYDTTGLGHLDVGERVVVGHWEADGTAQVSYRDAEWLARHHGPHLPQPGAHRIVAIESTCLVLEPA